MEEDAAAGQLPQFPDKIFLPVIDRHRTEPLDDELPRVAKRGIERAADADDSSRPVRRDHERARRP